MFDVAKAKDKIAAIKRTLTGTDLARVAPLTAAELDLERKVLENELRDWNGLSRSYDALRY